MTRVVPGKAPVAVPASASPTVPVPGAAPPAGRARIEGIVTDRQGGALPFANVLVVGTNRGAASNAEGKFVIDDVEPDSATVRVVYLGYETREIRVGLQADHVTTVTFALREAIANVMDTVTVTAKRELIRRDQSSSAHSVGREELAKLPVDTYQESGALKSGVVAQGGQLHFRGGRSGEANYQIDGIAVNDATATGSPGRTLPNSTGGTDPVNGAAYDAMFFRSYGVNPFMDPRIDALATFAADVDHGSYTLSRSYLERGNLPPAEAVRVEEFINAFPHDYAPADEGLAIRSEIAPSPFREDTWLLRVGLRARDLDRETRPRLVLTWVVDNSGSMSGGNRLELARQSLRVLLRELRPDDRVGIVVFSNDSRVLLEPTDVGDGRAIRDALACMGPRGGTNAGSGLQLGYQVAAREWAGDAVNRVILVSDGVANVGITGSGGILEQVAAQVENGIDLTTVGVGMGNYNDVLLEQLADNGNGNYYYVDALPEAEKVFGRRLLGTLATVARDVKIQVEFPVDVVRGYRLIGYENRDVADEDFRDDDVDAGEIGAGHEVTALFEVRLETASEIPARFAEVRVRYEEPTTGKVHEIAHAVEGKSARLDFPLASAGFRFDAAVAEFAEILRGSYWARRNNLGNVLAVGYTAAEDLERPEYGKELVELVSTAARLRVRR